MLLTSLSIYPGYVWRIASAIGAMFPCNAALKTGAHVQWEECTAPT